VADLLRRLAALVLGVADYLTARLVGEIGSRLCCAADDIYCQCEGDTHG
jgi:hypothetical protein